MQFGFYTPNFDYCGKARVLADLAAEAKAAWWVEYVMTGDSSLEQTRERIRQGPPRP